LDWATTVLACRNASTAGEDMLDDIARSVVSPNVGVAYLEDAVLQNHGFVLKQTFLYMLLYRA
jgi:hypothetical protein